MVATSPGWMSVVAFGSSITAGPSMLAPAGKAGRQTMRVRSGRAASVKITSRQASATGGSALHGCDSQRSASVSGRAAVTTNRDAIKTLVGMVSRDQLVVTPISNSGYGVGESNAYCTEESPLRPVSLYGRTKVEAEEAVEAVEAVEEEEEEPRRAARAPGW